jgi:hypothetical protein
VYALFWIMLGLLLLALIAILFVALRPGRVTPRQMKRAGVEVPTETELEARRHRTDEFWKRERGESQGQRDDVQATAPDDPDA